MRRSIPAIWPFMLILLLLVGCRDKEAAAPLKSADAEIEQQPRSIAPTENTTAGDDTAPKETPKESPASFSAEEKPIPPTSQSSELVLDRPEVRTPPSIPRSFEEGTLLPESPIGLIVIHPRHFFDSPLGKLLTKLNIDKQSSPWTNTFHRANLPLAAIERITVVLDQPFVNSLASAFGLKSLDLQQERPRPRAQLTAMKQLGLAFHNYHDVYSKLPRANGDGDGKRTGLSWRVHLLPFIEQAPLYEEFHLDEAWDSDHNRTLIPKMPAIFKSPDVEEKGKTSFHVFTGEKTPFHGDVGFSLNKMTDGTANTLLAVLAGADTAEVWTKPGGLDVNFTVPKKCLGDIAGGTFLALRADGAVFNVSSKVNDLALAQMIQPADGSSFNLEQLRGENSISIRPTLIISLTDVVNQTEVVSGLLPQPAVLEIEGKTIHHDDHLAIWFPYDRTVALGSIESVKAMVSASAQQSRKVPFVDNLRLESDLTAVITVNSRSTLIREITKLSPNIAMINNVDWIAVHATMSLEETKPFVDIELKARGDQMAINLAEMAESLLVQLRNSYENEPLPATANESDQEMRSLINRLLASTNVLLEKNLIQIRVPAPEGLDRLPALVHATLAAGTIANQEINPKAALRQLGFAFQTFHNVHKSFPGSGRSHSNRPVGLSWRVHLLPYLDHAALYNEFKLDEPWDSDHNRKLIPRMPEIYRSLGVDTPGKTSLHVFTGPQTPFADEATPQVTDISDGTSNTILVVQGTSDTAEEWTKPGGLVLNEDNPVRSIDTLMKDRFIALFFSGEVKDIDKNVNPDKLRWMIQHNDGHPLE